MARPRVAPAFSGRRRQVQHAVGETAQTTQAGRIVEIGGQRHGARRTPAGGARGVADHGVDAVTAKQLREDAAGDIASADNQDVLHAGIVAAQA